MTTELRPDVLRDALLVAVADYLESFWPLGTPIEHGDDCPGEVECLAGIIHDFLAEPLASNPRVVDCVDDGVRAWLRTRERRLS